MGGGRASEQNNRDRKNYNIAHDLTIGPIHGVWSTHAFIIKITLNVAIT
jgi:hypothetical protein